MNYFRTSLLITISIMLLLGCNKTHAPARPSGVPASAVWSGGPDGGAFFDCVPSQRGEPNPCTVYDGGTGEVYMSGKFIIQSQNRGVNAKELKYGDADGNRIYLQNNVTLIPLSPQRPTSVPKTALLAQDNGVYVDCRSSDNNLYHCSLYLAATGKNFFTGSYRCDTLPDAPCTAPLKYANRDEIVLQNAGDLKLLK